MAGADPEKLRESKSFHVQHIQVKPSDPDPYYWVGVIEWKIAYAANVKMRKDWNDKQPDRKKVKDEQPMPPALRAEFAAQYAGGVDEGINYLKKALEIDPMYENAMAYLNLLYRQKADMAATDQEVESYLAEADKMIEKVKEVRQKKSEQPPAPTQ
jgi:tetratricopeptide (TPR) repeat protein